MEQLKHECGVALVRLLKPQSYYKEKYGTQTYGLNKLYLMMEKQHNRGQEGAGIACVNMDAAVGTEYMLREKAMGNHRNIQPHHSGMGRSTIVHGTSALLHYRQKRSAIRSPFLAPQQLESQESLSMR